MCTQVSALIVYRACLSCCATRLAVRASKTTTASMTLASARRQPLACPVDSHFANKKTQLPADTYRSIQVLTPLSLRACSRARVQPSKLCIGSKSQRRTNNITASWSSGDTYDRHVGGGRMQAGDVLCVAVHMAVFTSRGTARCRHWLRSKLCTNEPIQYSENPWFYMA